ncbi:hypothetical protein [Paracoccus aminophilus]|uniref:Uncharacterized protein n=1 Tax=Paracoccus aminophilus JCM 7686 TaxID=1367847 RepID=S5XSD5_PARAH|nr:hypothetical protein [Paracoccus aminophilus]AGT08032.1 hypothetical protein JCM7686_0923 [Paracoccus aminophilus JCM 7686]
MGFFSSTPETLPLDNFRVAPGAVEASKDGRNFMVDLSAIAQQKANDLGNAARSKGGTGAGINVTEGGRCKIVEGKAKNGIRTLTGQTATDGKDYWFPYPAQAVGHVEVPADVPKGTIVATPPMNGCSLVVTKTEDGKWHFFHDPNGEVMFGKGVGPTDRMALDDEMKAARAGDLTGQDKQRTQHQLQFFKNFRDYAGGPAFAKIGRPTDSGGMSGGLEPKDSQGQATVAEKSSATGEPHQFGHSLISVKTDTGWDVYNFGVVTKGSQNEPEAVVEGLGSKKLGSF